MCFLYRSEASSKGYKILKKVWHLHYWKWHYRLWSTFIKYNKRMQTIILYIIYEYMARHNSLNNFIDSHIYILPSLQHACQLYATWPTSQIPIFSLASQQVLRPYHRQWENSFPTPRPGYTIQFSSFQCLKLLP